MAELNVLSSGGFRAAYLALIEGFDGVSGHTVVTTMGGSMGDAPTSIPSRLRAGEVFDVVIMAGETLDELIAEGHVRAGSRVDLARSLVGVAVRAGASRPDISTADAVKRALLAAKGIAFSNSASGVYLLGLFERMGIAEEMRARRVETTPGPSGAVVARGDAELAFQQVSELLPVEGIDFLGPLPDEIQQATIFAAGIPTTAQHLAAARALLGYLSAPAAAPAIIASGMEPG